LSREDLEKEEKDEEKETSQEQEEEEKNDAKRRKVEEKNEEKNEEKEEKKEGEEGDKKEGKSEPLSFSFGASAATGSFSFGSGTHPFSFGSSSSTPFGSSSTFTFASAPSDGPFKFSFAESKPLGDTGSNEKADAAAEDEGEDPEKEVVADVEVKEKMKTLSKEELKNGEEGEETVYSVPKMKLYELGVVEESSPEEKKETKEEEKEGEKEKEKEKGKEKDEEKAVQKKWFERGLGVLRLNVDKETKAARILIRREPTHQSMANFNIIHQTKVTVDAARKSVTIQTIEPKAVESGEAQSSPEGKISFYMIRVGSKEIAEELCAEITKRIPE